MREIHHAFKFTAVGFVIVLIVGVVACHRGAPNAGPPWPGKMTLSTDPAQPIYGKNTTFRLELMDESGQPLSGAEVKADLKMRTMDMGKNVVTLTDQGNGLYHGNGQFTMAGQWSVIVSARKGSKSGWQKFEVVAKR